MTLGAVILAMAAQVAAPSARPCQPLSIEEQYSLPAWVESIWKKGAFQTTYEFCSSLNPFYQRGDFDGDGQLDFATQVRALSTGKVGVAVFHRSGPRVFILGAGQKIKPGLDDLSWMDAWAVFDGRKVERGVGEGAPPKLREDSLLVFRTEAASAIVWFDGKRYQWYQQED
jgi:hypothetical protein